MSHDWKAGIWSVSNNVMGGGCRRPWKRRNLYGRNNLGIKCHDFGGNQGTGHLLPDTLSFEAHVSPQAVSPRSCRVLETGPSSPSTPPNATPLPNIATIHPFFSHSSRFTRRLMTNHLHISIILLVSLTHQPHLLQRGRLLNRIQARRRRVLHIDRWGRSTT